MKLKHNITIFLLISIIFIFNNSSVGFAADVTIDSTTYTDTAYHQDAPTMVWINSTKGYMFYQDVSGGAVYSKTTDSGATWSAATSISIYSSAMIWAVWYDQWTPGNVSGTNIYIGFGDSADDDIYYETLNTITDTFSTVATIDSTPSHISSADTISITKNNSETVFVTYTLGAGDSGTPKTLKCSVTCTDAANWAQTSNNPNSGLVNEPVVLMPVGRTGNVMLLKHDITNNDVLSKVYYPTNNSWDSAWTTIDSNAVDSTTYLHTIMPTIDQTLGDIYLSYGADVAGAGTADVRTAKYTFSSMTWTSKTNVITNQDTVTHNDIIYDESSDTIYDVYMRGTIGSNMGVYWKNSTDEMATWSTEQGPINSTTGNLGFVRGNIMTNGSIRHGYVAFLQVSGNYPIFGTTIFNITTDLTPPPPVVTGLTGQYWVNYSWTPGIGNPTTSYNYSFNGTWTNGTTNTYVNNSVPLDGWGNLTIYAFNGVNLSTPVTMSLQVIVCTWCMNTNITLYNDGTPTTYSVAGSGESSATIEFSPESVSTDIIYLNITEDLETSKKYNISSNNNTSRIKVIFGSVTADSNYTITKYNSSTGLINSSRWILSNSTGYLTYNDSYFEGSQYVYISTTTPSYPVSTIVTFVVVIIGGIVYYFKKVRKV